MALPSEAQNARSILILGGAGRVTTHAFELMFPTLAVTIAGQTGLPLEQVLGWGFLGYLLFGLGALPAALLAERVSSRPLLLTGLFGIGVAALAASEAPNGRVLSFCLALMGACASVPRAAGMCLVSRTAVQRPSMRGTVRIASGAAIVLTPVVTATLSARLGWQATYRVVGYLLCGAAVACGYLHVDERRGARTPASTEAPRRREGVLPFAVLLAAAALAALSYRGATFVLPGYFAARVSASRFGVVTSLVYLFGVAGQHVVGRLAKRWHPRRLYLAFHALSLPALLLMAALAGLPLIGVGAAFAFFSFGIRPIEAELFAGCVPSRWGATAYGGALAFTSGIGALGVWLVEWAGVSYALLYLADVVALVVGAAALLDSLRPDEVGSLVETPSAEFVTGLRPPGTAPPESLTLAAPARRPAGP